MKKVKFAIKLIIILFIIFFLVKKLIESWDKVAQYDFEINITLMIISLVLLCLGYVSVAYGWKLILSKLGENLKFKKSVLIFYKSQISRYVPGVIWPYIGRIYLAKKERKSGTKTLVSLVLESVFLVSASAIISFVLLFPYLRADIMNYYLYFIIGVGVLVLFHPKVLNYFVNLAMRMLKRDKIEIKIVYSDLLILFFVYIVRWFFFGIAFIIFTQAIYPVSATKWLLVGGVAILSWLIGYLFVIVPGGIGVKEAVVAILLQPIMPVGIAIIIALASRIWLIIGELITFFVFYLARE